MNKLSNLWNRVARKPAILLTPVIIVLAAAAAGYVGSNSQARAASKDNATEHFWFTYKGQPDPGRRVWMRIAPDTWAELYPNGTVSRYKTSGRARVNGGDGTTVQKLGGDTEKTFTRNDGSFEVFIPDRSSTNRLLFYHHRMGDQWSRWTPLAPITTVD